MILILFVTLLTISLIFIAIGFAFDIPIFTLVGSVMMFSLGIIMLESPITYVIGDATNLSYGVQLNNSWADNGGTVPSNSNPYVFSTESTDVYGSYNDASTNRFGWLIAALGALAFVGALFTL